ncbi:MAG TPA: class I SAM-dependent methyltransferase [Candidatus Omnitrophica bacterium]|nr:class I SAM-dependent methyltransferase [Candidatus Omnitrophota bacterium]
MQDKIKVEETKDRFGFQWNLLNDKFHAHFNEEFDEISPFIQKEDFAQKIVLDAGCGTGRITDIAAKCGAKIAVGVDISPSVYAARINNVDNANAFIAQADLNSLPFKPVFDIITSIGVLHHTPDAHKSFLNLGKYLKPGGRIEILIYAKEGSRVARIMMDVLRKFIYKRSHRVRNAISFIINIMLSIACGVYFWAMVIFNKRRLKSGKDYLIYLYHKGFIYRQVVILDNLSTPIIHFFSRDEIASWFKELEFENFKIKNRNNNTWCAYAERPFK